MSWEGELSDQEMSSNSLGRQELKNNFMDGVQLSCNIDSLKSYGRVHQQEPKFSILLPEPSIVPVQNNQQSDLPLLVGKLLNHTSGNNSTPNQSPVLISRRRLNSKHDLSRSQVPSPDSAIHSNYSVISSPTQSPHATRHSANETGSPITSSLHSLSKYSFNNSNSSISHSLSRNNSDASSSCYSYDSISPPNQSPIQQPKQIHQYNQDRHQYYQNYHSEEFDDNRLHSPITFGISTRQQLINSPCPVCGDKISGFHYGIFSCESCKVCKNFFKLFYINYF